MMTARCAALALVLLSSILVGFGGPRPFQVAPFVPSGSNFSPGAWVSSSDLSGEESVNLAVMATWCGHCKRMLEQLNTNDEARGQVDMVLFFDTEYQDAMERAGQGSSGASSQHLVYPDRLADLSLPLYFAKRSEFGGLVSGYPTLLSCSREGCRRLSRSEIGLR